MPEIFLPRIASHTIRGFLLLKKRGPLPRAERAYKRLGRVQRAAPCTKNKDNKKPPEIPVASLLLASARRLGESRGVRPSGGVSRSKATHTPLPRPRVLPALWWRQQRRRHYHARGCYPRLSPLRAERACKKLGGVQRAAPCAKNKDNKKPPEIPVVFL